MRIIVLEDNPDKYLAISNRLRGHKLLHVQTVEEGIQAIQAAEAAGAPFQLAITDMYYPVRTGQELPHNGGTVFLQRLKEEGIALPAILCSSERRTTPGIYGSLWYSQTEDWEYALDKLLEKRTRELRSSGK